MLKIRKKIMFLPLFLFSPYIYGFNILPSLPDTNKIKDELIKNSINKKIKGTVSLKDIFNINTEKIINANLINIPGLFGLGIKCDINKNLPIIDPCKLIKPASSKFSFNLGPCKIDVGLSNKCLYKFYKEQCKKIINNTLGTPIKTARASAKELKTTGDIIIKKYAWNSDCSTMIPSERIKVIKNSQQISYADILKKYETPQVVYKYAIKQTGNNGIFDSNLVKWKDCIFNNAGKNDVINKCNIEKQQMPKTEYDVVNNIVSGTLMLENGINDSLDNDFKNLLIAQKFFALKCANSNNPQECENKYWENGFTTDDNREINFKQVYNNRLQKIEKSNALLLKYIQYATLPDKDLVFLSEDFIQTLPAEKRESYRKAAERKMYQKILNNYYIRQITEQEKAAVSIEFDAIKVATSQFYPKEALKEIEDLTNTFSMLSQQQGAK